MKVGELRSSWLNALLTLVGVVIVGWVLVWQLATGYIPGWVFVVGVISIVSWILLGDRGLWRPSWKLGMVCAAIATVFGAIGAAQSDGLLLVPAAIAVARLVGELRTPLWVGGAAAIVAVALVALGSLTVTESVLGLLSLFGGVALGVLGGINRRQARLADRRERDLREQALLVREEQTRLAAMHGRQVLARDMHDVLAHSLGGLVIQLDATDALLESGRLQEAATRVRDARALAVSGLQEARRAVAALREPDVADGEVADGEVAAADAAGASTRSATAGAAGGADVAAVIGELAAAHERLGGRIRFTVTGRTRAVSETTARAFRGAAQETLSNARKHAPGAMVTIELAWLEHGLTMTVSNALPDETAIGELAVSGGGNGLRGMRERFDALPGGRLSAGVRENSFVVVAEAEV